MLRTIVFSTSILFSSLNVFALDQEGFNKGVELYRQRSYVDQAKVQNALLAAKQFEAVLPTAANAVEQAQVNAWISQSYFSYGDALHSTVSEDLTDPSLPMNLSTQQRIDRLVAFKAGYLAGIKALNFLGVDKPFGERGSFMNPLMDAVYPYDWEGFSATLNNQTRPLAAQALYYLAAAYSQYNSTKRDLGANDPEEDKLDDDESTYRFFEMYEMANGLGKIDASYFFAGSNRFTGRLLERVQQTSLGRWVSNTKIGSTQKRLADANKQFAVDPASKLPVSRYAFNTIFLADFIAYTSPAKNKATAKKLMEELVANESKLDKEYGPENEIAILRAKNRIAGW